MKIYPKKIGFLSFLKVLKIMLLRLRDQQQQHIIVQNSIYSRTELVRENIVINVNVCSMCVLSRQHINI
jgi:hypothetical protein